MSRIKMLIMDVDGTMTDGSINISPSGELFKRFDVKDGYGIKMAFESNIHIVILTGRDSEIVKIRAKELGIGEVMQNVTNKKNAIDFLCSKYNLSHEEIAYIGDDLNDYDAITSVGLSFCPADAVSKIKEVCSLVLTSNGGHGAIRECIEHILYFNQVNSE